MLNRWITYAVLGMMSAIFIALIILVWVLSSSPESRIGDSDDSCGDSPCPPPHLFERGTTEYENIGEPAFQVLFTTPKIQLPDLRSQLIYYGTNERPDAGEKRTLLHFSFAGNDHLGTTLPDQPLYLTYDKQQLQGKYRFSPGNKPTNLWIRAEKIDNSAHVSVTARDASGHEITDPPSRATFTLQEKEFNRTPGEKWEIGKWRVDGTLLARQKARWFGQDQFLNAHGGEEFLAKENRERIEFGEKDDRYALYLAVDECIGWDGSRWVEVEMGAESRAYPLLCLKKVEDRLMKLELWDVGGKGRISLNLLKSTEAWAPQVLQREFKFISARTLSQYVLEIRGQRMVLRPNDWLLLTEDGWKKLETPQEIDSYVEREVTGVLFTFDGITKKDDKQVLQGTLYNTTRSAMEVIEIPLVQSGAIYKQKHEDEDEQDDESFPLDALEQEQHGMRRRKSDEVLNRPEVKRMAELPLKTLQERIEK